MYELKKFGKVLTSKSIGTGPSSYEKRIYRVAVSQRLRSTVIMSYRSKTGVTDSCAVVSEPIRHPHRPSVRAHSQLYVSVVPLLHAKLPHFLLVVPIKASSSSHPRLRLAVSLPPIDGWLAFLFRVLEVPGSNLVKKGFRGFSYFLQKFPVCFLKLADNRFPPCPFQFIFH